MGTNIDLVNSLWEGTALTRKASVLPTIETASDAQKKAIQKEALFNSHWNAPDGMKRVAFSLNEPLKTRLDYVGIGRKLLMVDELPAGDVPFYDLDMPEYGAVVVSQRGSVPTYEANIKRISIPTFEITVDQIVKYLELTLRKYPVFDRAKERVAISMAIAEDDQIFDLVIAAAKKGPNPTSMAQYGTSTTTVVKSNFADLFGKIASRQLQVKTYALSVGTYADMLKWNSTDLDPVSLNIQVETGQFGALFGIRAIASTRLDMRYNGGTIPADAANKKPIFALTTPDKLGRIPERKAVEVKIFDDVKNNSYSIVAWEVIGTGIYNCGGIAGLEKAV